MKKLSDEIESLRQDYARRAQAQNISPNTIKCAENALDRLLPFWGGLSPKDITKEKWSEFQDQMEKQFPGQSQFNLRKIFTVLIRHLLDKEIITKKIQIQDRFARRERNQRRKKKNWVFTSEEIKALDKACKDDKERIWLRLGYMLGFRISDMVQLTWDRIIIEAKTPYIEFSGSDDKASKIAKCPLPNSILELLLKIPKTSKWVFPQCRNPANHIKTQQINFEDLKRRAKVTRGSPHSLRHYCLTRDAANPKLTPAVVCKVRRVSMDVLLEFYFHTTEDDLKKMIQDVD